MSQKGHYAEQSIVATIAGDKIPETNQETDESILNEVISCIDCKRKYKIIKLEFDLLKKMGLPPPRRCPRCRESTRFKRLNPIALYDRTCDKCKKEIRTPYSPERPEIIYCEQCYQQEVY